MRTEKQLNNLARLVVDKANQERIKLCGETRPGLHEEMILIVQEIFRQLDIENENGIDEGTSVYDKNSL